MRVFIGSRLLLCVLAAQAAFVLALTAWLHFLAPRVQEPAVLTGVLASFAAGMILVAGWTPYRGVRGHSEERNRNNITSSLMDTVLDTSQEWLWAVDGAGTFTFSSSASTTLLGYEPRELVGRPFSQHHGRSLVQGPRGSQRGLERRSGLDSCHCLLQAPGRQPGPHGDVRQVVPGVGRDRPAI
ncbi:PAS domain-containing protein [Pseudarthrobacter sp. W1I19]|uniref:PAS domain-containing protein n=1 Tax=Pseudarthrobacter sp. W1I19 TaxID=3042288 RepID=UPI0027814B48|nr:PAS domain-containing protein [Pseudarthrobacter sp. W1I19]MDQ0925670.1 PAS domain-containing protein [Pseudarthrobacter sp. W1I19]